jgi:uncharacterized protein (TIRG00374 family)
MTTTPADDTASTRSTGGSKASRIFTWVTLAIALVALSVTVYSVGLRTILGHLASIGWWFALVLALELVVTGCDAAALAQFLAGEERDRTVSYRHVFVAQLAGRAINSVTPGGNLGEATKVTMLLDHATTPRVVAAVLRYNIVLLLVSFTIIGIGGAVTALVLDLPSGLELGLYLGSAFSLLGVVLLLWLVKRGFARTFAGIAGTLRILSKKRRARWQKTLEDIDARLLPRRLPAGSKRRARLRQRLGGGTAWVLLSKVLSWIGIWTILAAAGHPVGPGFLAAIVTAGVLIGWISNLVPMGLGISETGNYALFRAMGADPALGVTLVVARRVVTLLFAAIGLILIATNETVARTRKVRRGRGPRPVVATRGA